MQAPDRKWLVASWRAAGSPRGVPVPYVPARAPEGQPPAPWPAPEVRATTDIPVPVPGPVGRVRRHAEAHGWTVVVTYARGTAPAASNRAGTPGAVVESVALRMSRGVQHVGMTYERKKGKKDWTAKTILVTGPDSVIPYLGVTALEHYLAVPEVPPATWFQQIKHKQVQQKAAATAAARSRPTRARQDVS